MNHVLTPQEKECVAAAAELLKNGGDPLLVAEMIYRCGRLQGWLHGIGGARPAAMEALRKATVEGVERMDSLRA